MIKQTAGRNALGEFAPMFAHLNDDVLFGEVWNEKAISVKMKCIVTVVSLMASGITRFFFAISPGKREKKRRNKGRNCRNHNPCHHVCGLAEGLGGIPYGERGMERRIGCW